ncbi:MAG: tryptophan--tRNA ligase [Sutterellaceae bacterium]|nr:tryptophan--tRNA ligase [Sutterellaceae bacterium]MDD7442421.1 tryptophan--tRNA ligase [Sutterellaceae bacterium]MDY2868882.1 tryptophan--tRNA ligase [Mesosutterella sp.]
MKKRVLTGITPSGTLHLGNYVGAVRPSVEQSRRDDVESFYFLSDLHALIKNHDPERLQRSRLQIAATWLAAGLDPERVTFYRQSDIPETPVLNWLLDCVCPKGLMNRAHAYKAKVEESEKAGEDPDARVSMGLFCYPILMAADILLFNADLVPVGKDQSQHLEMARDIAIRFNNLYAPKDRPFFHLPYGLIDEKQELLPGTDGRKMSKSYDNVIPLFEGGSAALAEMVKRIVTDDKKPGEPKDPDSSSLTLLYRSFSTNEEYQNFRHELEDGLGWGEAKEKLYRQIEAEIGPMRPKYDRFMNEPAVLEEILQEGAKKARRYATPFLEELIEAVGLQPFTRIKADTPATKKQQKKKKAAAFKQYRDPDGTFGFKLEDADGTVLLVSSGWASGAEAGRTVARLKKEGAAALASLPSVKRPEGVDEARVEAALSSFE